MRTLNRVIKVRLGDGNDVVRHYPVFQYETMQEAIDAHGSHAVLQAFNDAQEKLARVQELRAFLDERDRKR